MEQLVNLFLERTPEETPNRLRGDEFTYLENTYLQIVEKYEKATHLVQDYSVKVLKDMLKQIMDGKQIEDANLQEMLTTIGSPVALNDRYLVMIGHLQLSEKDVFHDMEQSLYIISVYEIIENWKSEKVLVFAIYTYFDTIAVVLTAPPEVAVTEIQRECIEIRNRIGQETQNFPHRFYWGVGKIYEHISDLRHSFRDAADSLRRQMYYEGEATDAEPTDETGLYLEERVRRIAAEINDNNRAESYERIQRMLAGICSRSESVGQAMEHFEKLCDGILEKMLSLHIPGEELQNIYSRPLREMLSEAGSVEQMANLTGNICRQSLRLIELYSRKSKYVFARLPGSLLSPT